MVVKMPGEAARIGTLFTVVDAPLTVTTTVASPGVSSHGVWKLTCWTPLRLEITEIGAWIGTPPGDWMVMLKPPSWNGSGPMALATICPLTAGATLAFTTEPSPQGARPVWKLAPLTKLVLMTLGPAASVVTVAEAENPAAEAVITAGPAPAPAVTVV